MSIAYFKKFDPRLAVVISTGETVKFEPVTHEIGVYPKAEDHGISPRLIEEFRIHIREGRSGIEEVSRDAWLELLKKKAIEPDGTQRPWREEFKPSFSLEKHLEARKAQGQSASTTTPPPSASPVVVDMHNNAQVTASSAPAMPGQAPQPPTVARPTASAKRAAKPK